MRFITILFLIWCFQAQSQGVYTEFGQNSTQVYGNTFSLKLNNFEVIYFEGGEQTAHLVINQIQKISDEIENKLNYNLSNGLKIIVFNNIIDYQKSNLNISNPQQYAGGYATLNDNISSVYYDGNTHQFNIQIRKAVAEIIISEFIYGGNIKERVQTAALLHLPDWYFKGLVDYIGESWNVEKDNILKDFFQNKKQRYFSSLQKQDEVLAGHSIWRFIEEKFGSSAVGNIVFLTRLSRSTENSILYYTGMEINQLLNEWSDFYKLKYKNDEIVFKLPKGEENAPKKISKKYHTQFKISPDGKNIAIVTNTLGKFQVFLYDLKSKKTKQIAKGGKQLLNRDMLNHYPLIAWDPQSKHLTLILYQNKTSILKSYNINGQLIVSQELKDIPFVNDFDYSSDGNQMVLSVLENAQTNLILYQTKSKTFKYILKDQFDKINPKFSIDNNSIFFASNQYNNKPSPFLSIYQLNINDLSLKFIYGDPKEQINFGKPLEIKENYLSLLSDKNGVINNYALNIESKKLIPLTSYKRSILYNDVSRESGKVADLLYFNNQFRIYVNTFSEEIEEDEIEKVQKTEYRKFIELNNIKKDTQKLVLTPKDSLKTNEKIVSIPSKKVFINGFEEKDDIDENQKNAKTNSSIFQTKFQSQLGINFFLQQSDNSILNNYLFPANVSETIFNFPLFSPLMQVKLNDPLKNHIVEASIRIPISIKASDMFFSYTNNSKRWDKKISIIRRSRSFDNFFEEKKVITGIGKLSLMYPISESSRFEINTGFRNDRNYLLPFDTAQLKQAGVNHVYFSGGLEYVFDNVRSTGLNLFEGLRVKIYNENYQNLESNGFISNNGFDFRYYLKIHRQIYLATRMSGAASMGSQNTAYYMGGVENWIIGARSDLNFNYNIPTLNSDAFAFQTIVSPMRGFNRNVRGGNKYVLVNAELRIPVFAYLIQKPISSPFLKSIMLMNFMDFGTAWLGSSPYSKDNPFNTTFVKSNQYLVSVTSRRNPFIYSFGVGLRAKILGHYVKLDHAWGYIENKLQKPMTTFSLGLDF